MPKRRTCCARPRDFAQRDFPIRRHRELVETKTTFDPETWQKMAGLGWLGQMVDEAHGGTGGNWVDLIVLLEEMGRALLPMTFLAHPLAGLVIQRHGDDAQRRALLPAVASGERVFAVAIAEPRATLDPAGIQCEARRSRSRGRRRGRAMRSAAWRARAISSTAASASRANTTSTSTSSAPRRTS